MAGKTGGKRPGSGRKKGDKTNRGRAGKSPKDFMTALVPVGPRVDHDQPRAEYVEAEPVSPEDVEFSKREGWVDPVEFCQAVINGDVYTLTKCGVVEIPDLDQKLEASRIAAPYTNKKKPVETVTKHEFSLMDAVSNAEHRIRTMRMETEDERRSHDQETVN